MRSGNARGAGTVPSASCARTTTAITWTATRNWRRVTAFPYTDRARAHSGPRPMRCTTARASPPELGLEFRVLEVPTGRHIVYYGADAVLRRHCSSARPPVRGHPGADVRSAHALAALPAATAVLRTSTFWQSRLRPGAEPDNGAIRARQAEAMERRASDVPSALSIGLELTNPSCAATHRPCAPRRTMPAGGCLPRSKCSPSCVAERRLSGLNASLTHPTDP